MSLNSGDIRVGKTGELYVAAIGATGPSNAVSALDPGFTGLGHLTPDGANISRSVAKSEIFSWQGGTESPVLSRVTGQSMTVQATFLETNAEILSLWTGSAWSANGGEWSASSASVPTATERAVVIEWTTDGGYVWRVFFPRCVVEEVGEIAVGTGTESIRYQVTFKALSPSSGDLVEYYTNDPAANPA